jgi:hypothetical protein
MTFIPVNLDEVQEQTAAPIGRYELQVTGCEDTVTGPNSKRPGSPQFRVSLGFLSNPEYQNINMFLSLPNEDDEPRARQFKMLNLRRFLELFNVPYDSNGIDTEKMAMDIVGATANCEVRLGQPNANGNVYNEVVLPPLKGEVAEKSKSGRRR